MGDRGVLIVTVIHRLPVGEEGWVGEWRGTLSFTSKAALVGVSTVCPDVGMMKVLIFSGDRTMPLLPLWKFSSLSHRLTIYRGCFYWRRRVGVVFGR